MPHPNEDFIKKFLGKNIISPAEQKAMLKKQRLNEYYNALEQSKQPKTLDESVKKDLVKTTEKIFYRKPKYITEETQGTWVSQLTPYGVFHYNKTQNLWMNNYGVIKPSIEELIALVATDYLTVSESSESSKDTVVQSFFSDDGNTLAVFNSASKTVKTYSITYTPSVSTTLLKTVNVGSTPFTAATNEKCFISNDGNYLVLSSPSNKSVYFFDVNQNTLLQTITEDQPLFGSLIAVDKDFYGMAISSTELNRDPSIYDVRSTSYDVSTKIHYYKRNYKSKNSQKFVKIHSNGAWMQLQRTGIDGKTTVSINPYCYVYSFFSLVQANRETCTGVMRISDLQCKNYNWAQSMVALPADQKNYNAVFLNADNTRYNHITSISAADTTQASLSYYYRYPEDYGGGISNKPPSDNKLKEKLVMYTVPSVKKFSIIRKIDSNTLYEDKSYLSLGSIPHPFQAPIPRATFDFGDNGKNGGYTFYLQNYVGTYVEKTFGRTMVPDGVGDSPESTTNSATAPLFDEYVLNTKIGINDTHTYNISQVQTGTGGDNTICIKIQREFSTNADGSETFLFQDGITDPANISATPTLTPSIIDVGMVKFLYDASKASLIESTYYDNSTMTASQKTKLKIFPTKPFLSNPSSYSQAEFAFPISTSILNQTLQNVYVSNNRLFINFTNNTIICLIDTNINYKPVIYVKIIDTLKNYKFTYNNNGMFFSLKNNIFKYNTTTENLELVTTLI